MKRRRGAHGRPAVVITPDDRGAHVRSVCSGGVGLVQLLPAVRQPFVDPLRRVRADSIEHIAEVSLRVDPQILAGRAQAHQHGRGLASLVAPCE